MDGLDRSVQNSLHNVFVVLYQTYHLVKEWYHLDPERKKGVIIEKKKKTVSRTIKWKHNNNTFFSESF